MNVKYLSLGAFVASLNAEQTLKLFEFCENNKKVYGVRYTKGKEPEPMEGEPTVLSDDDGKGIHFAAVNEFKRREGIA